MSDITAERKASALSDVIASVAQLRDHHAAVAEGDRTLLKGREGPRAWILFLRWIMDNRLGTEMDMGRIMDNR